MASSKIGVILAQVGTPDEPTKHALKPYLQKFLSDERIIDAPRWQWLPILHGIVLRRRPKRIAKHYADIWTSKGSPLMVHSKAQVRGVQERLGNGFRVVLGLAYAEPSMQSAVHQLEQAGITKIIVVPLFPQFSTTTTASVYDEIMFAALGRDKRKGKPVKKYVPTLRFVPPYYNDPTYIKMLATNITKQMRRLPHKPDKIIISFHGIPKRYDDEGDPYRKHVQTTTKLLAVAMGWERGDYLQTFQSRFGREEWLQPYTQVELPRLAKRGIKYPLIIAPGFVTDCLETIHELDIEARELIHDVDGDPRGLMRIECLNDDPKWLDYLARLVKANAQGW